MKVTLTLFAERILTHVNNDRNLMLHELKNGEFLATEETPFRKRFQMGNSIVVLIHNTIRNL